MRIIGYQLYVLNPNKTYTLLFYCTLWGAKRSPYIHGISKAYISPIYEDHTAPFKYVIYPYCNKWTRLY